MSADTQKFIDSLEAAARTLDNYPGVPLSGYEHTIEQSSTVPLNLNLFEHWASIFNNLAPVRPTVRIIQHLSCTGGTLIAKCLAGLPNVVLLNEVNPLCRLMTDSESMFSPTNMIYLTVHGCFPFVDELSEKIFQADMNVISEHAKSLGKYLVVRDHSHSDFLVGESVCESATVLRLLKENHPVLSVYTVRHPVDSYLSLLMNGWIHYTPSTFDEYCRRYLLFVNCNKDIEMYKYEDFVNDPQSELKRMCDTLQLPFNPDFQDIFDINSLSGDSGRSSNILEMRDRQKYDEAFFKEANASTMYLKLCEVLNYESAIDQTSKIAIDD